MKDLEAMTDVLVGITTDLRDLRQKMVEHERHMQQFVRNSEYPEVIEDAVYEAINGVNKANADLRASLRAIEPLAHLLAALVQAAEPKQEEDTDGDD